MNWLIILLMIGPGERTTAGDPVVDSCFVGSGKLCVSGVDAFWAIVSYVVTNVTDNAVVGAEPNSSCHPWQGEVLASSNLYNPACFVGTTNALWTLEGASLGQLLGIGLLSACRVGSALGSSLVGVTL